MAKSTQLVSQHLENISSDALEQCHFATAIKRSTQNGWTFWHYERGPGDWVPIEKLRK